MAWQPAEFRRLPAPNDNPADQGWNDDWGLKCRLQTRGEMMTEG